MSLNRSSITICLLVLLSGFGGVLVTLSSLYLYLSPKLPAVETLRDIKLSTPLRIYSADGKFIAEYGDKKRIPVSIEEVPPLLIKALIAIEDDRFYSHNGVDVGAFLRAASQYLLPSGTQTGGSTLTMQVAKNAFNLEADGSLLYKANQILLALQVEKELSKEEILELYLNINFLGKRAYGIGAAAQVYYGRSVDQLSLAQMASLVGTYQLPSSVNPISNPSRALRRRNLVLARMLELGHIDQAQFELASKEPLAAEEHDRPTEANAPYVAEMVWQEMRKRFGDKAGEDGFSVYVTIDSRLQNAAQKAVVDGLIEYDLRHGFRGPEFQLEPEFVDDKQTANSNDTSATELDIDEPLAISEQLALLEEDEEQDQTPVQIYHLVQAADPEQAQQTTDALNRDFNVQKLNVTPWMNVLTGISSVAELRPAAVLEFQGEQLKVLLKDGSYVSILWENGPSQYFGTLKRDQPDSYSRTLKRAQQTLPLGAVVRVRETNPGEWHLVQIPEVQGAMIALDPRNGAIKALVGGLDFYFSNFNRVEQARRQPGSNFKPFLYTAALENGYSAGSIIIDKPYSIYDSSLESYWQPQNDDGKFLGPMRLRQALYGSRNVVSIHLRNDLGHSKAFKNIGRFGIDYNALPNNDPSLVLGTYELTPRQLATAYAVFANGGYKVDSYFIDRIETLQGEVIFQENPITVCEECLAAEEQKQQALQDGEAMLEAAATEEKIPLSDLDSQLMAELQQLDGEGAEGDQLAQANIEEQLPLPVAQRVIDERTAYIIDDILKDVIKKGTGKKARELQRGDIAGKTGTTNDSHDLWFSGYGTNIVTTSWVGYDEYKSLGEKEFGGTAALPPWINFMREALKGVPEKERPMPAGLEIVRINSQTGKPTSKEDPDAVMEIFKVENSPLPQDGDSPGLIFDGQDVDPTNLF